MRFLQPAGVHKIGDNAFIFEDGGKYVQLSTRTDDKRVCITRVILEIFGLKVCGAVASSGLQGQPNGAPYVVAGADFIAFETAHSVAMKVCFPEIQFRVPRFTPTAPGLDHGSVLAISVANFYCKKLSLLFRIH